MKLLVCHTMHPDISGARQRGDANGNLIKDLDRDIVTIKYNLLNLPLATLSFGRGAGGEVIQFKNGNQIRNLYDAGGQKLNTRNYTVFHYFQPIITIGEIYDLNDMVQNNEEVYVDGDDYLGNIEYKFYDEYYYGEQNWNGINLKQVNNPEGFFNNSLDFPIFNYFRRDHLGNNREVWRAPWSYGSTNYAATTTQRTQYYPSGLPWASNSGDNPWVQNKKYNDKEFIEMHGLDEYDSEARWYYPAIMRTTTIDPLTEKYYSISPYAWCGNNPIIAIDPTGEDVVIWYKDTNSKSGMSSYRYSGGEVKSTNSYVRKVVNALNYNINNGNKAKNGGGDPSKTAVNDHSLSINIYETDYQSQHDPGNNTVYWNPELGTETENGIIRSPASVMDHELDHAIYKIKYPKSYYNGLDNTKSKYGDREEERVITGSEQKTAIANGEIKNGQVTRTSHKGNYVVTHSETSTTVNKEKTNTKRKKIDEHNSTWTSE